MTLPALDHDATARARDRQASLTKPRGSLGALEDVVATMAAIQGRVRPRSRPATALIAASDHAVTKHGVSAYPAEVTRAMIDNLARGGAAASVMCASLGVPLVVLDVGVAAPRVPPQRDGRRVIRDDVADVALGDLREARAVSPDDAQRVRRAAVDAVSAIDELAVLVLGEIGIGNTTAAAAVVSALLDIPAERTVGPGTGLDGEGIARKRAVVSDAVAALGGDRDPWSVLARVGGRDLLAMAAAAHAAMQRRAVVLADGYVVAASLLALSRVVPDLGARVIFGHCSAEPAHRLVLDALGARPLLDLGMRLGEASGALAALPLLDLACALHEGMATFAEAAVPDRE
ncbi:nicotinate-nucleotide--dimethylbenzimidazole phosphoribosyltransferase [Sandaracinus amylolyticus]|uniref:Nicotinate-nucleotide--dimethylbenzimidazole phosphoribosyltransferase n=1 Tax=Sandaracinus amylolyticus TaxID=927083 RepID=A0A0F6YKE9_9BACT|nr:nicotinate-nucleotide--dimethylbenzimidazole phosphoribosyltransferase [Sandaracinus amylolyticus]AKF08803.1 Nicotinate-nucleotide--dimethylbenzimidazole phosphoribosyltransferase [Sandaracinus amylolyticus]